MVADNSRLEPEVAAQTKETQLPDSEAIRQAKIDFRRVVDSEVAAVASGEEYYVLMLDSESTGEWMKRVPGKRRAVLEGQRLWRIPDNWEYLVRITDANEPDVILYEISENGMLVVVEDLEQSHRAETGYKVRKIGKLDYHLAKTPDKQALLRLLKRIDDGDIDVTQTVEETLQTLFEHWHKFELQYEAYYNKWCCKQAWEALRSEEVTTLDSWSFDPWENDQIVNHCIANVRPVDREVCDVINELFFEAGVVGRSPNVELSIRDEQLPPGYRMQALIESGCSPEAAADYLIERFKDESYDSWDCVRETDSATVQRNVQAVRDTLFS